MKSTLKPNRKSKWLHNTIWYLSLGLSISISSTTFISYALTKRFPRLQFLNWFFQCKLKIYPTLLHIANVVIKLNNCWTLINTNVEFPKVKLLVTFFKDLSVSHCFCDNNETKNCIDIPQDHMVINYSIKRSQHEHDTTSACLQVNSEQMNI